MNADLLVPPLESEAELPGIVTATHRTGYGLTVLACQMRSPLTQVRLRVPWADLDADEFATATVLGRTLLAGTFTRSGRRLAEDLQTLGAKVEVAVEGEHLLVAAACVPSGLDELLATLAEVLSSAAHPATDVLRERRHLAYEVDVAMARPDTAAHVVALRHRFGGDPYSNVLAAPEALREVTAPHLHTLQRERLAWTRASLVVLCSAPSEATLDVALRHFEELPVAGAAQRSTPLVSEAAPAALLVPREGAMQATLVVMTRAVRRPDPLYAAAELANLGFGGYFSSRLVSVLREERGYSYAPSSRLVSVPRAAYTLTTASVSAAVAADALEVVLEEFGRLRSAPFDRAELAAVRAFAVGSMAMRFARSSALAPELSAVLAECLPPQWLAEHYARLREATPDQLRDVVDTVLDPAGTTVVVAGDPDVIGSRLHATQPVVTVPTSTSRNRWP
ncbi:M16 family metallopeptidase [Pseudonocardia sp. TRM90224]|uniref:M16 family metallopeptidase n=1 Tax=Pseudonocardia sp. TRM90224 TaxID=2812678 RepID=UPI001E598AFC|nr:insulinase family protein [Pseudonocardia sp. TRM90224]